MRKKSAASKRVFDTEKAQMQQEVKMAKKFHQDHRFQLYLVYIEYNVPSSRDRKKNSFCKSSKDFFSSEPGRTFKPHFVGHSRICQETTPTADMEYNGVNDIEMKEASTEIEESSSENNESASVKWTWQREVLDEDWLDKVKAIVTPSILKECKKQPNVPWALSKDCKSPLKKGTYECLVWKNHQD